MGQKREFLHLEWSCASKKWLKRFQGVFWSVDFFFLGLNSVYGGPQLHFKVVICSGDGRKSQGLPYKNAVLELNFKRLLGELWSYFFVFLPQNGTSNNTWYGRILIFGLLYVHIAGPTRKYAKCDRWASNGPNWINVDFWVGEAGRGQMVGTLGFSFCPKNVLRHLWCAEKQWNQYSPLFDCPKSSLRAKIAAPMFRNIEIFQKSKKEKSSFFTESRFWLAHSKGNSSVIYVNFIQNWVKIGIFIFSGGPKAPFRAKMAAQSQNELFWVLEGDRDKTNEMIVGIKVE